MSENLVLRLKEYYLLHISKKYNVEKEWKYHEYVEKRSEAEKNGDESFVYKNITYVQSMTPSGNVIYVRKPNL